MLSVCRRCHTLLTVTKPTQYSRPSSSRTSMPRLDVSPQVALVDEKICVTASGLRPVQKVTLQTWLKESSAVYSSCAQFVADQQGCVDTTQHSSLGGTYKGTDSMGLFWSLRPVPGMSKKTRLMKADVTTPLVFELSLLDGHLDFDDLQHSPPDILATATCERWYKHGDVRRIVVRESSLRGTMFLPTGSGPFPGVIDMCGIAGGLSETRAALLASRGFASFALAYFGFDNLPTSVEDVEYNYFQKALDWFSSQSFVHPGGVGLVGESKGGELAFIMGMSSDKVKAVVNVSGSPALGFYDLKKDGEIYVKAVRFVASRARTTSEGVIVRDCFPDADSHAIIPVWKKNAKVLYLCGEDDSLWPAKGLTDVFKQTCPPEKLTNIEVIVYPGAGHAIEPPHTPLCRSSWSNFIGGDLHMGGSPKPHAAAQEDSWRRLLKFLHTHLDCKRTLNGRL